MKLSIGSAPRQPDDGAITVVIVSGACCFPPLRANDLEARRVVEAAILEVGRPARVVLMTMAQAYYGGLPRAIAEEGKRVLDTAGITSLPAVLVNLELVSYGIPTLEAVVTALRHAAEPTGPGRAPTSPAGSPAGGVR